MPFSTDFVPLPPSSLSRPVRYLIALGIVTGATLLRLAADPILEDQVPFFIYVGASVVATWVAGVEGGILSTIVAAFAGNYFFVAPRHVFTFTTADLAAMLTFAVFSLGLVWQVGRWRAAEMRVRALHARTADVLNQLPVAVVLAEPSGRVLFQNLAGTLLFGRPLPPSVDLRGFRDSLGFRAYQPDGTPLDPKDAPVARALRGETVAFSEAQIVQAGGTRRNLAISAAPIRDDAGRIVSAVATFSDVTEQKHAAEALRERAEEVQKLLDAVPAAVFVTRDPNARLMEGNRFAAEYMRVPFGSNLSVTAPAGEAPATFRAVKDGTEIAGPELPVQLAIARGIEIRDFEFDLLYGDGGRRTLYGNAAPLRDEDGRTRGAVGAFVDLTEQKRTMQSLRDSEARFRSVLDGSRDVIYRVNLQSGRYDYVSPSAERVLSFTADEVMASDDRALSGLIHPDDLPGLQSGIDTLTGTRSVEVEYRQRTKRGDYRWMSNHMWLVAGADGQPLFRDGNIRDVTDRKRIEAELQQRMEELERQTRELADSEARYRIMGETLPYGVWLCGPDGGTIYTSQSFRDLLGMTMEEAQQFGWTRRLAPEDVQPTLDKWRRCVATGELWDSEHHIVDRHGELRTVLTRGLPVRGADGKVTCWVGVHLDITDRKRMETQLRDQADALERANRVKDEFLATLSHELRTPLNAILGWSHMLLRAGLSPETRQKALESINRNAQAQAALIGDILDVSRIITGKLRLDVRPVDLADIVNASCESIQAAADARGVQIRTVVHPHAVVIGDPDRLQQVLWNLLSNSVKFSDPGGRIEVDVRQVDSDVRVAVRDQGIGMAPDLLPHVFERFRQADSSTTRSRAGLGLGLAIVRHLVELHGGTVTAESEGAGLGSTFTINLPIRSLPGTDADATRFPGAVSTEISAHRADYLAGLRIVAVDDQEETRVLIRAVLEGRGAEVSVCSTAAETLAALARDRFDVLVADIAMPQVDGYELIRQVRALPDHHAQTLPAVALTAYGSDHDRAKALAAGYWEHLAKPIMPDTLVMAVAAMAGRMAEGT